MSAVPIADPSRRQLRRISNEEIKSPVRAADYVVPKRKYLEVSKDHFVQVSAAGGVEP
jgi:peptide/nickel transport system ATP-binding protein